MTGTVRSATADRNRRPVLCVSSPPTRQGPHLHRPHQRRWAGCTAL